MRRHFLFLVFLIFLFPVPALAEWQAVVVDILDGDTLIVSIGGRAEIIRLFGIDCPEKKQNFYLKAKYFTSAMVAGKTIGIITKDQGRYPLCKVYLGEKSLNEELLKAGYAWHYSSNEKWAEMEQIARAAQKGIWSEEAPVPPWDFRKTGNQQPIQHPHTIKFQTRHKTGTVKATRRSPRRRYRRR